MSNHVDKYIKENGIKMVKESGGKTIDVKVMYSYNEIREHTTMGWVLEGDNLQIKMWNIIKNAVRDIEGLEKRLSESDEFVKCLRGWENSNDLLQKIIVDKAKELNNQTNIQP